MKRPPITRIQQLAISIIVFTVIILIAIIAASIAADQAAAQTNGDQRTTLAEHTNAQPGDTCTIDPFNNTSIYDGANDPTDTGNELVVTTGNTEHRKPVERTAGTEPSWQFTAEGPVTIEVEYRIHTSMDLLDIHCTPPPTTTTTTTPVETCSIADAIDAGWTPGGTIPCGHHQPTVTTAATSTSTPPPTTQPPVTSPSTSSTSTTTHPAPPCPPNTLACTGTNPTTKLAAALLAILAGTTILGTLRANDRKNNTNG